MVFKPNSQFTKYSMQNLSIMILLREKTHTKKSHNC